MYMYKILNAMISVIMYKIGAIYESYCTM